MMGQRDYNDWTLAEYSQVLNVWNARHDTDEGDAVEPPSEAWVKHRAIILAEKGWATGSVH